MPKIYKDKICGYQIEYVITGTKLGIKREDEANYTYMDLQGVGLDFKWNGTKLGIKKETDTDYQYLDVGGASLEYNWNGTELGVRQEGETEYTYTDLKGASIEYDWNGTKLGIKNTDESAYAYTDLKGEKGDPNILTLGTVNIVDYDKGAITITGTAPSQIVNVDLPVAPPTNFTVGTVIDATDCGVNITGTAPNQVLNFELKRGKNLEYDWNGTKLGVRQEGETTYIYTELKGDKGDEGDQGIQGIPGIKGDQGYSIADITQAGTDASGGNIYEVKLDDPSNTKIGTFIAPKGAKGDTGATGATGAKGDQGIQGIPGAKGDQGDPGPSDADTLDGHHGNAEAAVESGGEYYKADPRNKYPLVGNDGVMEIGHVLDMHIYDGRAPQDFAVRIQAKDRAIGVAYVLPNDTAPHDMGDITTKRCGVGGPYSLYLSDTENTLLFGMSNSIDDAYLPNGHFFSVSGLPGHKPYGADANFLGINVAENLQWEHSQIGSFPGDGRLYHRRGNGGGTTTIAWDEWQEIQQIVAQWSDGTNGYIKYSDGNLIQQGVTQINSQSGTLVAFFLPFVAGTIPCFLVNGNTPIGYSASFNNLTNTGVYIQQFITAANALTVAACHWLAIGRWY